MVYSVQNNQINVHLENKNIGLFANFMMSHSSANQTFQLKSLSESCFKAIQIGHGNNSFRMCKLQ